MELQLKLLMTMLLLLVLNCLVGMVFSSNFKIDRVLDKIFKYQLISYATIQTIWFLINLWTI